MIKGVYELFYQNNVPFRENFHLYIYQPKCIWEETFIEMEEMEILVPGYYYRPCGEYCCIYDYTLYVHKYFHIKIVDSEEVSGIPADCYLYTECTTNDCIDPLEPTPIANIHINGKQCRLYPGCPYPKISILEGKVNTEIQVQPIPAEDKIFISSTINSVHFEKIEIFNSIGIKVFDINSVDITQSEFEISIEALVPGIYYILMSTEENAYVEKIIVQ